MENKTYRNYFLTEEAYERNKARADKRIKAYGSVCMNNSKWKKLFLALFANIDAIKQCEVIDFFGSSATTLKTRLGGIKPERHIHSDCIDTALLETGEYPVSYREIEYLEFKRYSRNEGIGERGSNQRPLEQDIGKIRGILERAGRYEWEVTEEYIRILGYK
ncbi:MAG: hypothetical protein LBP24_04080 [Coriobacteriales bacterium]|nr:hypothetical protein [Coriobacteriales bacterium]